MIKKDFRYRQVYEKGKPNHIDDEFSIKHPKMDLSRRAKIFSPFDALKGFDEEIAYTKQTSDLYTDVEIEPFEEYP